MSKLDDERIERYSRQLILQEVGPRGQERLADARVAVIGTGAAAERVVAYLGATGIGHLAADPTLHAAVDPAQPDCRITAHADAGSGLDARVVVAASADDAAAALAHATPHATATFWIADGYAGGLPPCPRCAVAATASPPLAAELAGLRDALLGTVVATEVVKAILAIGTSLAQQILAYDPATATITTATTAARPTCDCVH